MRPTVKVKHPDGRTEEIPLTRDRTIIGRSSKSDIQVKDQRISREHCALEVDGDRVYVIDLGGSNGTWIGSHKILANVQEPFPLEAVVHVGPAEIRLVSTQPDFDPEHDLESRAFSPTPPARPITPDSAGIDAPAPAALELTDNQVDIEAGQRASLQVSVTNQSKLVEHYTLSVTGLPASWVTVPRAGMELLPRQSGALNVEIHPPRHPRSSAGIHPITIVLLDGRNTVVANTSLELELAAFDNLEIDVRPNPYQSRSGGDLTLTVENHGNAETDYRIDVLESSDALEINIDPRTASVAPQQSRQSIIHIRPKKRNWIGKPKRMNMTVTVSTNNQSVSSAPAYNQLSIIPRWLPILFLLCCCILIPFFGYFAYTGIIGPTYLTKTATPTSTPENTPTATPNFSATETVVHATEQVQDNDGDGLTNGEEEEIGTDPDVKDTDNDMLTDHAEADQHGTDPLNDDTDGDTLLDGIEVSDPCLSPVKDDTDGDGIPDQIDNDNCSIPTPTITPVPDFGLGGQVNNTLDNLAVMDEARMSWVKVQLRYGLGANPSSAVQDATKFKEKGKKVLLSVVGNREDLAGGSGYYQTFASFLGDIATVADAIEVWNEPNIDREWPEGQINPAEYTELLRASYNAIKASNPATVVISAAPAPTGVNSDKVMSDDLFIRGMLNAGAGQFMDCIGIHYNQGATPPSATSGHPDDSTGHYSYYYLPMIDLYYDTFNAPNSTSAIPLCFTEIGYLSDDGFDLTLAQAGANGFLWADGVSVRDQGEWLEEALLRACRSGKVKLFIVWNVGFTNYGEDPQAGYAILRPNDRCESCEPLARAVGILRNEGCMR